MSSPRPNDGFSLRFIYSKGMDFYLCSASYLQQDALPGILQKVAKVSAEDAVTKKIEDNEGLMAFGLWAPTPQDNTILYTGRSQACGMYLSLSIL